MSERAYLGAVKVAKVTDPIPGSQQRSCSECHDDVWVSPATMPILREHSATIVCIECLSEMAAPEEFKVEPLNEAQQRELDP